MLASMNGVEGLVRSGSGQRTLVVRREECCEHCLPHVAHLKRELPSEMVRKLKFHEQKLLKKVDFLNVCLSYSLPFVFRLILGQWKQDANLREVKVMRRYHIQDREDYHKYTPHPRFPHP